MDQEMNFNASERKSLSLHEFNNRVKRLLNDRSVQNCWVVADLSDVAIRGGHCYLELVEKNDAGITVAKVRGIIWAGRVQYIRSKFLAVTGQDLKSGLKVMVEASVNYHEQYGLSVIISDIDPSYTIGDMERLRREILARLQKEGVIDMNRRLPVPEVVQRIAVISAAGAAGYGDFINQLHNNSYGLQFYTCLFPAVMQGQNTVPSVIAALERIAGYDDLFDCVVIIRGGGSTSDLNCFDDYDLAANVAQFPLPVVVGIGHERDVTVLDYVAAVRVKTPTAAAEWLIGRGVEALAHIDRLTTAVTDTVRQYLDAARQQLAFYTGNLPLIVSSHLERNKLKLAHMVEMIPTVTGSRVSTAGERLKAYVAAIKQAQVQAMARERLKLKSLDDKVEILSPQNTLRRGYSITLVGGHAVSNVADLHAGDVVTTRLANGTMESTITKINKPQE